MRKDKIIELQMKRLARKCFFQNTDEVAKQLIGKLIVMEVEGVKIKAIITETESYHGSDAASHKKAGKKLGQRAGRPNK